MSIDVQIQQLCSANRLTALPSRSPRSVFVSNEVRAMMPFPDGLEGAHFAKAWGMLESFAANMRMTVRWNPAHRVPAVMARTCPPERGVFDFRTHIDDDGLRVFGLFAKSDCFIALTYAFRKCLKWSDEIDRCANSWSQLMGDRTPVRSEDPNDYFAACNYLVARSGRR